MFSKVPPVACRIKEFFSYSAPISKQTIRKKRCENGTDTERSKVMGSLQLKNGTDTERSKVMGSLQLKRGDRKLLW
jgi:hypothetical protein